MACRCGGGGTVALRFRGVRRPRWSLGRLSGRATFFPSIWRQAALTLPHPLDRAIIFGDGQQAEDRAKILKREHFVGRLRPAGYRTVLREALAASRQAWGDRKSVV